MRKIVLFNIFFSVVFITINGQTNNKIGINTDNPQKVLHIDAKGDTNGSTNITDDIVIDENGNLGIGTLAPGKKMDIVGSAILDGNNILQNQVNVKNYLIVNDTLRIGADSLNSTYSRLEIFADQAGKGLRFDNGSQQINDDPTLTDIIPVLTQKNDTLLWSNLQSIIDIRSAELIVSDGPSAGSQFGVNLSNAQGAGRDITDGELELTPGDWLICAGVATAFDGAPGENPKDPNNSSITHYGAGTVGYGVYLNLRERISTNPDTYSTALNFCGTPSEKSGSGVSNPQLIDLIHIPTGSNKFYKLYASTSLGLGKYPYYTTNKYGSAYFYAIKLK